MGQWRMGKLRNSPGGPVVETSASGAGGSDLIPGQGAKIPQALRPKKKKKKPKHKTEAIL